MKKRKVKRRADNSLMVMLTAEERAALDTAVARSGSTIRDFVANELLKLAPVRGKWSVKIIIVDTYGKRPKEVIERFDNEDTEMVLKLCQVGSGQIVYDGYNAMVNKPIADPIRRELVYTVELFGKSE